MSKVTRVRNLKEKEKEKEREIEIENEKSAKDPSYINPNSSRGYKAHPAHILTRYYCRINNTIILPWRWKVRRYEGSAEAATEAAFVATLCQRASQ